MRRLANARDDALDRTGAELGVPRFADTLAFRGGAIVTDARREPDDEYRRRLRLYRPWFLPTTRADRRGAERPRCANRPERRRARRPRGRRALHARRDEQRIRRRDGDRRRGRPGVSRRAARVRARDASDLAGEQRRGERRPRCTLRSRRRACARGAAAREPAQVSSTSRPPAPTPHSRRCSPTRSRARAPAASRSARRLPWAPARRRPDAGSRYELGLGADLAALTAQALTSLATALSTRAPNPDPEIEALLASMTPQPPADDPDGRWLLEPCGLRTVHRVDSETLYVSNLPIFGLTIAGPTAAAAGRLDADPRRPLQRQRVQRRPLLRARHGSGRVLEQRRPRRSRAVQPADRLADDVDDDRRRCLHHRLVRRPLLLRAVDGKRRALEHRRRWQHRARPVVQRSSRDVVGDRRRQLPPGLGRRTLLLRPLGWRRRALRDGRRRQPDTARSAHRPRLHVDARRRGRVHRRAADRPPLLRPRHGHRGGVCDGRQRRPRARLPARAVASRLDGCDPRQLRGRGRIHRLARLRPGRRHGRAPRVGRNRRARPAPVVRRLGHDVDEDRAGAARAPAARPAHERSPLLRARDRERRGAVDGRRRDAVPRAHADRPTEELGADLRGAVPRAR